MGGAPRRASKHQLALSAGLLAVALAALVLAPLGAAGTPARTVSVSAQPAQLAGGLQANVLWNGAEISTAATAGAAFRLGFNGVANLDYFWNQTLLTGAGWSINDARLQIFYFGFALGTRDIVATTGQSSGNLVMGNWSTGALQYVVEGTFELTASLLATNGTTAWSESFWVDISAPFYILAVLPLVLALIAVYEVYALCCSGQHVMKRTSGKPGTGSPSAAETAASSAPAAEEPPDPAEASSPPPGGSS